MHGWLHKITIQQEKNRVSQQRKDGPHSINVWYHRSSSKWSKLTLICAHGEPELFHKFVLKHFLKSHLIVFTQTRQWEGLFPHSLAKANLNVFLTLEWSFSHVLHHCFIAFVVVFLKLWFILTTLTYSSPSRSNSSKCIPKLKTGDNVFLSYELVEIIALANGKICYLFYCCSSIWGSTICTTALNRSLANTKI